MRRAAKIDRNQKDIVEMLREIPGVTVAVGHDDILVGREIDGEKRTFWFELKHPSAVSKRTGKLLASELTASELSRLNTWTGHYSVVWELDQILEEIGI